MYQGRMINEHEKRPLILWWLNRETVHSHPYTRDPFRVMKDMRYPYIRILNVSCWIHYSLFILINRKTSLITSLPRYRLNLDLIKESCVVVWVVYYYRELFINKSLTLWLSTTSRFPSVSLGRIVCSVKFRDPETNKVDFLLSPHGSSRLSGGWGRKMRTNKNIKS